jgi:GMP synthase (glutamine-hydrolysing)
MPSSSRPQTRVLALVLRHHPTIHLGSIEQALVERGYEIGYIEAPSADLATVDVRAADLLVVLGGDMGAYEHEAHPWLDDEIALIRRRLQAEAPVLGVCLGAQLMASALGSRVYRGPVVDVGFRLVTPTDAGLASAVRHVAGVPVFEWHGDTFDLPPEATLLASSEAYTNEAFGLGGWGLAVQFHPETTAEMYDEWIGEGREELDALGVDAATLRAEAARYNAGQVSAARELFGEWLDGLAPIAMPEAGPRPDH